MASPGERECIRRLLRCQSRGFTLTSRQIFALHSEGSEIVPEGQT